MPEFDGVELQEWAEKYGHPEEWAKRAQDAHARAERAEAKLLSAAAWVFRLVESIDELGLWEPGRKGYAAALRRLKDERDWAWREMSALSSTGPRPSSPQTTSDAAGSRAKEQRDAR